MAIHDGLRLGSFMDGHEGTGYCFMDSHDPLGLRARDWGKLALCILRQFEGEIDGKTVKMILLGSGHSRSAMADRL